MGAVPRFHLGAPRIAAQLLRPADPTAAPLAADLVVRYSRGDFAATETPLLVARSFGGAVLRSRLGDACSTLTTEPTGELRVAIHVAKCLAALEPDTNYEVIIPAACWSHGSKESPSSVRFAFHTVASRRARAASGAASEPPRLVSAVPRNAETLSWGQEVRLGFDRPVGAGSGTVRVDVFDMVRNALLYDSQELMAMAVVRGTDDPFVVSLDMGRFPFYPYALFNVGMGERWEIDLVDRRCLQNVLQRECKRGVCLFLHRGRILRPASVCRLSAAALL